MWFNFFPINSSKMPRSYYFPGTIVQGYYPLDDLGLYSGDYFLIIAISQEIFDGLTLNLTGSFITPRSGTILLVDELDLFFKVIHCLANNFKHL
jgi:hypothetical protein